MLLTFTLLVGSGQKGSYSRTVGWHWRISNLDHQFHQWDYDSTLNRADYFNFRMMPFPKCPTFWHAKEITGKFSSFNVQSTSSWTSVLVFLEPSLPEGSRWHSPPPEQLDLYKQISSARTAISSRKGERSHVCSQISHALRAVLLWSRMNLTSS